MTPTHVDVLDKGYVRYVDHMGDDLTIVNAARVSFDKRAHEYGPREERLIKFLFREGHWSTVRHNVLSLEVYAPLMVARQWYKYAVASAHVEDQRGWNESSRRYLTQDPEFYVPGANEWRTAPENAKQGSSVPLNEEEGAQWTRRLMEYVQQGETEYNAALEANIAPEIARLFLPAYGLYIRWWWTASLQTIIHFFAERLASDAQSEIHDYARAVHEVCGVVWPNLMAQVSVH